MISFCLEEFIESKQFARFFADLVSVQESCTDILDFRLLEYGKSTDASRKII